MKIALLDVQTKDKAVNKTMAGGFGTTSSYNSKSNISLFVRLLEIAKKISVKIPLIELAYLAQIFKQKGHQVEISYSDTFAEADLYLIYISLVESNQEIRTAEKIREIYPKAKIGFIGTLVTVQPELFKDYADFIIKGESEGFFLNYEGDYRLLKGVIDASYIENLDSLPFPNWSFFNMESFVHYNFFGRRPVYPILGSRGCPFSCRYYCAYPIIAGIKVRYRRIDKIIEELKYLIKEYNAIVVLFRDPNFSIDMKWAKELCQAMIEERIRVHWACETHLSCMDKELVDLMYAAGCRAITVGIESRDEEVIYSSKRQDIEEKHLRDIVRYCEFKGIKIMAGYIFGGLGDDSKKVMKTIRYAKKLNTSFAQFYIATPYPGTEFYKELEGRINTSDWELFDGYTLVFDHPGFPGQELEGLKQRAYIEYYYRPAWILNFARSKIRDIFDRW